MGKDKHTILEIMEDVKEKMCDKYCRFPYECEDEDRLDRICENCPLNRLEVSQWTQEH